MKYSIKFSKLGYLKYISHLDMIRLFKRAFKRAGILLKFSEGFNPHPKMVFAQPLSLGYGSICEIIDIETKEAQDIEKMISNLKNVLPEDINIISIEEKEENYKGISAKIVSATYLIEIDNKTVNDEIINEYFGQDEIVGYKKQKKKKELKALNIKNMIRKYEIVEADKELSYYQDSIFVKVDVDCGSISNLSPELIINTFIDFVSKKDIVLQREDFEVTRISMGI